MAAADLNCHWNWSLTEGATKFCVKDVIKEVENRMENDSWTRLPNYLFLFYLYNDPDNKDVSKAKKALEKAEKINENQQHHYNKDAIKWIIEANRFCMKNEKTDLKPRKLLEDFENFNDNKKATIDALHAFCLVRFGPKKFEKADELYSSAQKNNSGNFLFQYLHALLLAKIRRVDNLKSSATKREEEMWKMALENYKGDESLWEYLEFRGRYAEAALGFENQNAAVEAANLALEKFENLGNEELKALLKIHKVLRVLRYNLEKSGEDEDLLRKICKNVEDLNKKLFSFEEEGIKDSQFYHTLALERHYEAKSVQDDSERVQKLEICLELLNKAKKCASAPGHVYVDLMMIDIRVELRQFDLSQAQNEYESMETRYRRSDNNVATIKMDRGIHLIENDQIDDGMKLLKEAVEIDEKCFKRLPPEKQEKLKLKLQKRKGYLDWVKNEFNDAKEAAEKYKNLEGEEYDFVFEHIALLWIRQGKAESQLPFDESKLPLTAKNRIEMERILARLHTSATIEDRLEMIRLAKDFPRRLEHICRQLIKKLVWSPLKTEAFELCAEISLGVEMLNNNNNSDSNNELKKEIEEGIKKTLMLTNAEDSMRRHRYDATRLELKKQKTDDEKRSLNEEILHTFRTAKSDLDKSCKILFPTSRGYPFAFLSRGEGSSGDNFAELARNYPREKHDLEKCFKKSLKIKKFISKKYDEMTETQLKAVDKIFNHEIHTFAKQGTWLSLWINVRNDNEHNSNNKLIGQLNEYLSECASSSKNNTNLSIPQTAYEMMHRAAEYCEEAKKCFEEEERESVNIGKLVNNV